MGQAQGGAGGGADRLAVERIGGALVEQDRTDTERRARAQHRAHIVVIGDLDADQQTVRRTGEQPVEARLPRAPGQRQNAPVHGKARHPVDHRTACHINRNIRRHALDQFRDTPQAIFEDEHRNGLEGASIEQGA